MAQHIEDTQVVFTEQLIGLARSTQIRDEVLPAMWPLLTGFFSVDGFEGYLDVCFFWKSRLKKKHLTMIWSLINRSLEGGYTCTPPENLFHLTSMTNRLTINIINHLR